MSRIGKQPIPILDGVKVSLAGNTVNVEGPKGKLNYEHRPEVKVEVDEDGKTIVISRASENREARAYHGLTRAIINNMINLRYWIMAYAPTSFGGHRVGQEIHKLNTEMQYIVSRNYVRRTIPFIIFMGLLTRQVFKYRWLRKDEDDAFEHSWRDVHFAAE